MIYRGGEDLSRYHAIGTQRSGFTASGCMFALPTLVLYYTIRLISQLVKSMTPQRDALSETFAALADPTRRAILADLARGKKTVNELAEPFDLTLPAISKHLKVLERAQLIERSREAQYRPCSLHSEPLRDVDRWLEQYRKFFEESFDRLEEYLRHLKTKQGNER